VIVLRSPERVLEYELTFRLIAAANVLEDQEVAVAGKIAQSGVDSNGRVIKSVWRALDQEWEWLTP
jgi:hypothetical protein